jgi:arylsulfatase
MEAGSPVTPEYGPRGNAFNGGVNRVEIDVEKAALDQDHLLTGAERLRVALAVQ